MPTGEMVDVAAVIEGSSIVSALDLVIYVTAGWPMCGGISERSWAFNLAVERPM